MAVAAINRALAQWVGDHCGGAQPRPTILTSSRPRLIRAPSRSQSSGRARGSRRMISAVSPNAGGRHGPTCVHGASVQSEICNTFYRRDTHVLACLSQLTGYADEAGLCRRREARRLQKRSVMRLRWTKQHRGKRTLLDSQRQYTGIARNRILRSYHCRRLRRNDARHVRIAGVEITNLCQSARRMLRDL